MTLNFGLKIFIALLFSLNCWAYTVNRSFSGAKIHWANGTSNVDYYVDPTNPLSISSADFFAAITNARNEWQNEVPFNLNIVSGGGQVSGRNDIFFSNSATYFSGSDVLGVARTVFDQSTGEIIESDIIFNSSASPNLTTGTFSDNNISDIATHEFGHTLGLSHSNVAKSSMFYLLELGQRSLASDDRSGISAIYARNNTGAISGRMIGGDNLTGVFGSHIQAISMNSGKVIASAISEDDGTFTIYNLPINDHYFLYIEPLKDLTNLPSFYGVRRTDFCAINSSYRGSFFQSCYSEDEGKPYGININSSRPHLNLGNVSIRCNLDVPIQYLLGKDSNDYELNLANSIGSTSYIGEVQTGFFSTNEISAKSPDYYKIDLSSFDLTAYSELNGQDLYLEIKTVSQPLYSQIKLTMDVKPVNDPTLTYPSGLDGYGVKLDGDGNPVLDLVARVPLDQVTQTDNDFLITITPDSVANGSTFLNSLVLHPNIGLFASTKGPGEFFFRSSSTLGDDINFYLLMVNVVKKVGSNYVQVSHKYFKPYSDNSSCPDAANTYAVVAKRETASAATVSSQSEESLAEAIACGTIMFVDDDNDKSGPFNSGLLFLVVFSFAILRIKSHFLKSEIL